MSTGQTLIANIHWLARLKSGITPYWVCGEDATCYRVSVTADEVVSAVVHYCESHRP